MVEVFANTLHGTYQGASCLKIELFNKKRKVLLNMQARKPGCSRSLSIPSTLLCPHTQPAQKWPNYHAEKRNCTGVSIYGFYGHLMTSRNIEIVLSNPIASQFRYLGYGATPSGLKAAGNGRDNRLQCFLLIILIVRSRW